MFKRRLVLAAVTITLSGCSTISGLLDKAAGANDTAIDGAIFTVCQAASVGSIKRKFNTPELMAKYNVICSQDSVKLQVSKE